MITLVTNTFTIENPTGLHARPATTFVQTANSFSSDVNVIKGSKKVNGKSIMAIMTLAIAKGDQITLEIDGEDENDALQQLGAVLTKVHE